MQTTHQAPKAAERACPACAAAGPAKAAGGGCAQAGVGCAAGNMEMQRAFPVADRGSAQEAEADRVASAVMSAREPVAVAGHIGRMGAATVSRKPRGSRDRGSLAPAAWHSAAGAGRPLDTETRSFFEPRIGQSLAGVRVHTDAPAQQLADRLDAAAFTVGQDIAFAAGQYRPDTAGGRHLLAHELTHTVQQRDAAPVVQRNDKAAAEKAKKELAALDEKEAPKPGRDATTFVVPGKPVIQLSSDRAFVRRAVAVYVGENGWDDTDAALVAVERNAKWSGGKRDAMASAMRAEVESLRAAWKKFSLDTRTAGIARLKLNHKALGEWREYVSGMAPASVMNQTLATQELIFMKKIADRDEFKDCAHKPMVGPYVMKEMAEMRAWSPSPGRRRWVEALNNGEINGGCQDCHTQKSIPDYDASFAPDDPARIPPVFRMLAAADSEDRIGSTINPRILDTPVQGTGPDPSIVNMVQGYPGLTSIAQSTARIAPRIMPLAEQYKVIPQSVINRPYTPQELVAEVLSLIDKRREGYVELQGKMAAEDYDFLQLLPIVDLYAASVDADVRQMIRRAQVRSEAAQAAKKNALTGLGILAMLLTIFPPTAPIGIALGVGVAAVGLHQGYMDYQQGLQYMQGTGADVFSPEQEAAAGALMAGGIVSMALNAFALASAGVGGVRAIAGAMARPAQGFSFSWKMVGYDPATGVMTAVGKNLTKGSAGEMATISINVRTGMGTATMHGPNGMTVPIVNGRLQFSAGLLPEAAGGGAAIVPGGPANALPAGGAVTPAAPGTLQLPAGQGPSFIRGYLPAAADEGAGIATAATRPQLGSRVVLRSDAPATGEAPVYEMPLGPQGQGGVRLMNRGLRPTDFPNEGRVGAMIADDATHLRLWTQAESTVARSAQDNIYKRWLAAVQDGTVVNWTNADLHKVYKSLWDEYKVLARAEGIDVATLHHWNYNKNLYPQQVVDPRNLMPVYGQAQLRGGHHPTHQGGLHPLMSSGHPTRDPINPIHELSLYNYNVPQANPNFPGTPQGWHPPMLAPDDVPFGWNPLYPPEWPNWPGGVPPTRPPQ